MSLQKETGPHIKGAGVSFQSSDLIPSFPRDHISSPSEISVYISICYTCMEGSPEAAPKHRKHILNPYSQSHLQQHQQSQEILNTVQNCAGRKSSHVCPLDSEHRDDIFRLPVPQTHNHTTHIFMRNS